MSVMDGRHGFGQMAYLYTPGYSSEADAAESMGPHSRAHVGYVTFTATRCDTTGRDEQRYPTARDSQRVGAPSLRGLLASGAAADGQRSARALALIVRPPTNGRSTRLATRTVTKPDLG